MKNITKRDLKAFLLGFATMLLIELALNWDDLEQGFKDGYNGGKPYPKEIDK